MNPCNSRLYVLIAATLISGMALATGVPETVAFPSRDGKTQLIGYLFRPAAPGPHPAIVMLHGRSGSYSSLDSFSPRGYPQGFARHTYNERPPEVSEQYVRPLDAYGALDYLRSRSDVLAGRIGVQGWSNGGMTVLAALAHQPPGLVDPTPETGFRAALAFYPSCREQEKPRSQQPRDGRFDAAGGIIFPAAITALT